MSKRSRQPETIVIEKKTDDIKMTTKKYNCPKHGDDTADFPVSFSENHCYNRIYCLKCIVDLFDANGVQRVEAINSREVGANT